LTEIAESSPILMAETKPKNSESDLPGTRSIGAEPGPVAQLHGQNWLLVPAKVEEGSPSSRANRGFQFSTVFGLLVSVFAIVGAVVLFINPRFDDVNQSISRLQSKIERVEDRMTSFETSLTVLDGKLSAIGNMIIVAFQDGELDSEETNSIWQQASQ